MSTPIQEDSLSSRHRIRTIIETILVIVAFVAVVIGLRVWNSYNHRGILSDGSPFGSPAMRAIAGGGQALGPQDADRIKQGTEYFDPAATPEAVARGLYQARRAAFCNHSADQLAAIWEHASSPVGLTLPDAANTPETYLTDLAQLHRTGGAQVMCRDFLNDGVTYTVYANQAKQAAVIITGVGASANGRQLEVFNLVAGVWLINRIYSLPI